MAACGGDEEPGPDAAVRSYYRALLAGDGPLACARLTEALKRDIAQSKGARSVGGTCADALALAAGLNPDRAGDDLDDLRVDVDTDGGASRASLVNPLTGKQETLRLERVDGEWRIATLVLRPSG